MAREQDIGWKDFSDNLAREGWKSPDTYGLDFAAEGDFSAVYMFVALDDSPRPNFQVAYIGMSRCLEKRWAAHPTLRKIKAKNYWVKRLFKQTQPSLLREQERLYIQKYRPNWNIIGRIPGQ